MLFLQIVIYNAPSTTEIVGMSKIKRYDIYSSIYFFGETDKQAKQKIIGASAL